jgi:type VI secretion system protein ImpG
LFNNAIGVALAAPGGNGDFHLLESTALRPVGFQRDEGLVDYSPRSFLGYRLLSEFFAFPEKFQFFDLTGLSRSALQRIGKTTKLDVYIYLNQSSQDLERNVDRETFQLGCTPLVNLFQHRAEPIQLKQDVYEYRIVPDARRPKSHEIFSVDRVVATSPTDEEVEFAPLYSAHHGDSASQRRAFWHASRRASTSQESDVDHGTELYLALADLDASPIDFDQWIGDVTITCLNRDLPGRLPFGGGQPHLQVISGGATAKVDCLTPPTRTLRLSLEDAVLWRLVSMLSLNHLSLVDGGDQGAALREVLGLYDLAATTQSRTMIEGITSVRSRRVVSRAGGAASGGFCRGVEVTLQFDEEKFTGGGLYLFASVLDRFFGLYASINSFTRTRVATNRREGILCEWPPRVAERELV